MKIKKITSLLMALTVSCGVIQTVNNYSPVSFTTIAAEQTEQTVFFNEETGVLSLRGNVNKEEVKKYSDKVTSIIAEEGTVFPEDCSGLFKYFYYVKSIDLSKADTSNVKNMERMFYACYDLTSIDVSGFDTSKVEDMNYIFGGCKKLTSLDVSNFDTSKLYYMNGLFFQCESLTTLDVSNFDTSNVKSMWELFSGCTDLKSLDLSNFDTSKVVMMTGMFSNCKGLTTLDLSSFNTVDLKNTTRMFFGCTDLKKVYVGANWITDGVLYDQGMFYLCHEIVGGNGTVFDDDLDNDGVGYAHVDEPDNPGYFTAVSSASYETPAELKSTMVTDGALTYRVFADHAEVYECDNSFDGDIVIKDEIDGKKVTKIAARAFLECDSITSVVIPDTVKDIGFEAFYYCEMLRSVNLPDSLETLGVSAFEKARALGSIEIPSKMKTIESKTFDSCGIVSVTIPENIESIKSEAFGNSFLRRISIINPECDIYDDSITFYPSGSIYGHKGSTAEAYAKKYDIDFYALEDKPNVWGDANCDDGVDMADVVLVMQSLANPNKYGLNGTDEHHITEKGLELADVSRPSYEKPNGVTTEDALLIQHYLLRDISSIVPKHE